jgi:glycerol uptake facilitator-like aquaporin
MADKSASSSTKKSHNIVTVKATSGQKRLVDGSAQVFRDLKKLCKDLKRTPIFGLMLAEFIGTMILTITFIQMQSYPVYLGYAVVGIALIVGGISGAHLNPALSIGAWVTRRIKGTVAIGYIAAQVLGATVGWLIVKGFVDAATSATAPTAMKLYAAAAIPTGKEGYLFFVELMGAAVLGLGIAAAIRLRSNRIAASFVTGMSLLTALYISMVLSSALQAAQGTTLTFLNPAIAGVLGAIAEIGSKTFVWQSFNWQIAIYMIAPVLGGIIGFVLYEFMHATTDCACDECCACEKCSL